MDLNLHTSIIVVAAILVLLIFVDGLKRMLAARAEQKRLVAKDATELKEGLDLLKAELPNGGARSVSEAHTRSSLNEQNPPYARPLSQTESRAYQSKKAEAALASLDDSQQKLNDECSVKSQHSTHISVNTKSANTKSANSNSGVHFKPGSEPNFKAKRKPRTESLSTSSSRASQLKEIKPEVEAILQDIDELKTDLNTSAESAEVGAKRHVPMLMESVQIGALVDKEKPPVEQESIDASEIENPNDQDGFSICATPEDRVSGRQARIKSESTSASAHSLNNSVLKGRESNTEALKNPASASHRLGSLTEAQLASTNQSAKATSTKPKDPLFDDFDELDTAESLPYQNQKATTTKITSDVGECLSDRAPSEEILVIHVFSKQASGFDHKKLFALFKACDLRFGELSIFHRFERANAQGKIQFSVADVVKPGSFDPNQQNQTTPGIVLFMSLPGPEKPIEAFDAMAEVAQAVARNLDGVVKDEMLSVMTTQTLEHGRQCIHEFNRRQQLAKPSFA